VTPSLTILTWNLNGSTGVDVDGVAGVLHASCADVVVLQEVQRRQAHALAARAEMPTVRWAFKHWPVPRPSEGLAVLGPHPIERSRTTTITPGAPWSWRRRILLVVRVDTPLGPITVADAHLSPHDAGRRREAEARQVLAELESSDGPAFVVGDLNDGSADGSIGVFLGAGYEDGWTVVHGDEPGPTNWTHGDRRGRPPTQRLDHVLVPPGWDVVSATVGPGAPIDSFASWSDHLPLVVTVRRAPRSSTRAPFRSIRTGR